MKGLQGEQGLPLPLLIIYSKYWVLSEKREEKKYIYSFVLKKSILKIIRRTEKGARWKLVEHMLFLLFRKVQSFTELCTSLANIFLYAYSIW